MLCHAVAVQVQAVPDSRVQDLWASPRPAGAHVEAAVTAIGMTGCVGDTCAKIRDHEWK